MGLEYFSFDAADTGHHPGRWHAQKQIAPFEVVTPRTDRSAWHQNIALFHEYVSHLPHQGNLAGRQHFDPVTIPKLLSSTWLIDVQREPLRFRIRLMGTRLIVVLNRDLTGQWLDEAHAGSPALQDLLGWLERMAGEGLSIYRSPSPAKIHNCEWLNVETIIVPLARDGETVDMLAGYSWVTLTNGKRVPGLYG